MPASDAVWAFRGGGEPPSFRDQLAPTTSTARGSRPVDAVA